MCALSNEIFLAIVLIAVRGLYGVIGKVKSALVSYLLSYLAAFVPTMLTG